MLWGTILLLLLLFGVFLILGIHNEVQATGYAVRSKKISAPVTLAVIADLHSCRYGEKGEALLRLLEEAGTDLVLLVGDIIEDSLPWENGLTTVREFSRKFPCYYVSGNHEYRTGDIEGVKAKLRARNVTVLEGTAARVRVKGQLIQLSGIDDACIGEKQTEAQLAAAGGFDARRYAVLLAHHPERIGQYLPYKYDLIVCGHAHGGQVRIPFLVPQGLFAPNQGIFPRYTGGRWNMGETDFVVSRGLAKEIPRFPRIYNRPELVFITLLPKE
ncbi:MAG TPA: metallophosphoesterase [Feifaniaceae bacterium]|nr:metallophosphoesterase [Feifaniaceae bacterium]